MGSKVNKLDFTDLVYTNTKSIFIYFDKIFGQKDIEYMDEFELKKRSYYGVSAMIVDSLTRLFNECQDKAVYPYLDIASTIKNKDEIKKYSVSDLKKDIKTKIFSNSIKDYIDNYINETYTDIMDENTKEAEKTSKNVNKELQFTDEHVRILLKVSESIRIIIPLVTLYCQHRDSDLNSTLYDVFMNLITIYQGNINMKNKLHRFIYSRVVNTQYSDKAIWNLLSNKSKDVNVITVDFLKEIVIGILPKTTNDKNIINLFHVVVKRKLNFEFSKDYNITFKPVNLNQVDSEGLTPFDKWEISMVKKNESKITINKLSIKQQIKNIKNIFNIEVSDDEFLYYKDNIKINSFQTNLLFLFWAKYMGNYQNLYNCDYDEYIYLLITFYKWLLHNRFEILSTYIIATPDKLNEKRMTSNKSKLCAKITDSKMYKELLTNKYKFISVNLDESNTITKIVGNLSVSKFISMCPYEFKDSDSDYQGEELSDLYSFEGLASELLRFLIVI